MENEEFFVTLQPLISFFKMNNSTGKTFLLTLGTVAVLLLMGLLPTFSVSNFESRPVEMLSDLLEPDSTINEPIMPAVAVKKQPVAK